ncbi:hypothetical protein J2S78_002668 [Salibacterium salarium]|uniref:ABC transporter permease n=1 Tax=Salibacterium salarium TaxID=284579 RepID=UPI002787677F|nr:ABC transporter permease [Salibacterium salarium]MDQ0300221.1 hypothetical protein [Salibacterium salarium]
MNKADDNAWLEAWTQVTLFYGIIFLPISSGLFAAFVCRTEHLSGGWKLQFSLPIPKKTIYLSKLFIVLAFILMMQIILIAFFLIGGLINIDSTIPWSFLLSAVILSWVGTFTLATVQLWLSFKIKSFGIPLGINVILSLLVFAAYSFRAGMFYPWAQLAFAISSTDESPVDSMPIFTLVITITFLLSFVVSTYTFSKSELKC